MLCDAWPLLGFHVSCAMGEDSCICMSMMPAVWLKSFAFSWVGMVVVYESSEVLAAAWAKEAAIERLAVNHCVARLHAKQKINRSCLFAGFVFWMSALSCQEVLFKLLCARLMCVKCFAQAA